MPTPAPIPTFRGSLLAGWLSVGALVGVGIGLGLALLAGWPLDDAPRAVGLAAGTWLVLGALGALTLSAMTAGRVDRLPLPALGVSFGRMLAALAIGLGLWLAVRPDDRLFWTVFLAVGLASLIAETAYLVRALRPLSHSTGMTSS